MAEHKSGVGERLRELRRKRYLTPAQVGKPRMGHAYIRRTKGGADVVAVYSAPAGELVEHSEAKAKAKLNESKAAKVHRRPRKSR